MGKNNNFVLKIEEVVGKFISEDGTMKIYYHISLNDQNIGSFRSEEVEEVLKLLITGRKYLQSPTRLWQ